MVAVSPACLREITQALSLAVREIRVFLHDVYRSNIRRQFKLALHRILPTLPDFTFRHAT
jgi:hypothetical protein